MAARRAQPAPPTAGQRLIDELSREDDPYSLTFLIEQAAISADHLEQLNALLRGDRDAWLKLKIGVKTVEVVVDNVFVQRRQQSVALSRQLAEIVRQRAAIPDGDDDGDVLADL